MCEFSVSRATLLAPRPRGGKTVSSHGIYDEQTLPPGHPLISNVMNIFRTHLNLLVVLE
ncbi:hypothetical protein BLA15816_02036 [Burkholderia lata]|nr:hypothetical protein BLA15816_02036 [Burkholderia lata]